MSVICNCGFSFRVGGHLWVIVAEFPGPPVTVVAVSLTTKRVNSDTTVELHNGDHSFVKHDSVIYYADAREFGKEDLINRINQKFFEIDDEFDPKILKTIQTGLLKSPHTPKDIKSRCKNIF
jgi:ABC-type transporter lipoprotein component MlaA